MKQALTLALCCLAVVLASCGKRGREMPLKSLSPTEIADITRPATVQILVNFKATGEVARLEPDTDRLAADLRRQLRTGDSSDEKAEKLVNILNSAPRDYLKEGPSEKLEHHIFALGSGFIVTPDGYIVTNAHVVEPDAEELKTAALEAIDERVEQQTNQILHAVGYDLSGSTVSDAARTRLKNVLLQEYARSGKYDFQREVHVVLPSARNDAPGQEDERNSEVIKIGTPIPGRDVAILKIEGTDLPTVPLAASLESGGVRTGADLIIYGYPGEVSVYPSFSSKGRVQPSLSTGHVSGTKEMLDGFEVIQTDATVNPGNSGGPVFNDRGQVVGLATFMLKGTQGLNFAVSIEVANQFLHDLGVTPRTSDFSQRYQQAVEQYELTGHGQALHMFEKLNTSNPHVGPVRDFIAELKGQSDSTVAAQPAREPTVEPRPMHSAHATTRSTSPAMVLFVIVAAVLIAVTALVILSNRR